MNPTPISDVLQLPADALVYCVQGTLTTVYKRKSGTAASNGKPWALQNCAISDQSGTIDVQLKDRDDEIPTSWKNRVVRFECYHGDKGWSGVKAVDDEYPAGTVTRKLRVTPTGDVSLVEDAVPLSSNRPPPAPQKTAPAHKPPAASATPAPQNKPQKVNTPPPAKQQPPETAQPEPATEPEPTPEELRAQRLERERINTIKAKTLAYQVANLQQLCLNTVESYTAKRFEAVSGRKLTPEEKHAWAMNMNIEMCKHGAFHLMPGRKLETPEHKAEPKPDATPAPVSEPAKPQGAWPPGAVPHPETGEPMDPDTGEILF